MKAVTGATVHPISEDVIKNGTIIIEDGKIAGVGKDLEIPGEADIIDASGMHLIPGIVESHSHLVAHDRYLDDSENDEGNSNGLGDNATADLDYYWLFDPTHRHLKDALWGGITTALIRPGSGKPIDGIGFVTKTAGKSKREMILKYPDGVKMAMGENPKRAFGQRQGKMPSTRMGIAAVIRNALIKAENYRKKRDKAFEKTPPDPALKILVDLLDNKFPARVHAHRADDIVTAIRLSEEFGYDLTIEHATEGHKVADFIASRDIPCVVGPSFTSRGKMEVRDRTFETANILHNAGVKVSITTDAGVVFIGYLRLCAALACREGMPVEEALKAITLNAAKICGVDHRVGSLETGKDGDFVLLDGHPMQITSKVKQTYVNGRKVYDSEEYEEPWQKYKNPYLREE